MNYEILRKIFAAYLLSFSINIYTMDDHQNDDSFFYEISSLSVDNCEFGNINYAMTLDEIKGTTNKDLCEMKVKGLIISRNEFQDLKNDYFLIARKTLDRIWGVDYLKNKIQKSEELIKKYGVPNKYIIVADNPDLIEITICYENKLLPIPKLKNASIYFEKIAGPPYASSFMSRDIGVKSGIGYTDFNDPGNIILEEQTRRYIIVDTELRSFKFSTYDNSLQAKFKDQNGNSNIEFIVHLDVLV